MPILLHPTKENSFQTEQVTNSTVRGSTTPLPSVYSSLCWFFLWEIWEGGWATAKQVHPALVCISASPKVISLQITSSLE